MAVSPIALAKERNRQQSAQDQNFFRKFVYFFELRLSEEVAAPLRGPFLFPLALNPKSYTLEEPFTLEVTPTQGGGLYVEENGIVQRRIVIRGNTGFRPRILAGNVAQLGISSPDRKSFARKLPTSVLVPISGQRHFQYLQDAVFRTYADLKRDPATSEGTQLIFHIPKDDEHWLVAPQRFTLERDAVDRVLYNYSIEMVVLDKADATFLNFSEDRGLLQTLKDGLRMVKSGVDLAAGAIGDLSAIQADVQSLVSDVGTVINSASTVTEAADSFIEGTTRLIETPVAQLERTVNLVDNSLQAVDNNEEAAPELRKVPAVTLQRMRQIADGMDRIGTHPELHEIATQRKVREFKDRQEVFSAVSAEDLADVRPAPTTVTEANNIGTALTPGDVESAEAELGVGREINNYTGAREVAVAQGDTLVNLAARFLGDASLWQHIALLNGLQPPFVIEMATTPLGLDEEAFPGALRLGDRVLIPNFSKPPTEQPLLPVLGARLEETAAQRFLGTDLALVDAGGREGAQLFDLEVDVEGGSVDFKTVSGLDNMSQALTIRLRTEQGTDVLYKKLGLPRVLGLNIVPVDVETARFRIVEAIEADPRVATVQRLDFLDSTDDALVVDMDVELRGFTEGTNVQLSI